MIPLIVADKDKEQIIKKIGGNEEVKRHLANLGFVVGGTITIVNSLCGNVIVKVKESRVAINEDMARKIMV
ncbi:MAG: ferrous iron transport protein A [Treponema sp.]|jgi:ferrous iron transport protein A|nr:ferrous iron transport protein A [Treponema sp.]